MPAHQRRGPRIVAWLILIVAVAAIIYALIDKRAPPRTASRHGAISISTSGSRPIRTSSSATAPIGPAPSGAGRDADRDAAAASLLGLGPKR
jgi:hypothetical protein